VAKAQVIKEPNAVVRYFRETRTELGKVSWPTRREALNLTAIVLVVTTTMAIFLGTLDYLFTQMFELIIGA
jgi:preprotein translocase subunit SecE